MKMKINIIIVFLAITLNLISEEIKPDAVFSTIRHEYILNPDGSMVYNYEHIIKHLSYFSFNRAYGESFIVYNPDYQTLKVTKSNTIMANGEQVKSPFNAFNEVLPGFCSQTPAYMNLREMVVTHTGLEVGSEVNFAYTLTTKAGFLPGLFGKVIIGNHDLIQKMEIIIKVPTGKKLNLYMSNKGAMGEQSTEGNYDVYKWSINNFPVIPVENSQPALEEFLPTLYFSTISPADIVKEILTSDKDLFKLDSKSTNFVNDLLIDKFTFSDKVSALRDFVLNNIRSSNIDLSYIGLKPQKAQSTFDRASGSYLDNAILLIAMCRTVGLNAELSVTSIYPNAKPDLSLLSQFGNFLVFCKPTTEQEEMALLDPNHKQKSTLPDDLKSRPALVISAEKLFIIPEIKEPNYLIFSGNLKLEGSTLKGKAKLQCSGNYFENADIKSFDKKLNGSLKNQSWIESDKDIMVGTMKNNQFEKDIALLLKPEKNKLGLFEINLLKLDNSSFNQGIKVLPTSRITPYKLPNSIKEEYSINIELNDNSKVLYLPINITEENKVGILKISIIHNGKNLMISKKLEINREYIMPEDYHYLYKLISLWFDEKYNKIYYE